jgi:nucleotide sugar dehydrogenase
MTVLTRPSKAASLVGGAIETPRNPCRHASASFASPWTAEPGTAGIVAVVGAGKMGLPLCAQFASHDWRVVAVDVQPAVVDAINEGRSHVDQEPDLAALVATAHGAGRLRATLEGAEAAREADVVVLIVPVMLDDEGRPDYRSMDAAVDSIIDGLHSGITVIFETTLPVGDTRGRYLPRLTAGGLLADESIFVAFSPERLFSGAALRNLNAYPKLVGGVGPASTHRAAAFYDGVIDAEIVAMSSSEAAEFAKLAETTYRDVNIALANELARVADRVGVDISEVIAAANSQPYSHLHQPGLGVGGHCIPVYPHFLLAGSPDLELVALSRHINDGQVGRAVRAIEREVGGLADQPILVLGLTYREGVKELAYSRARALIDQLLVAGARVLANDPLLADEEIARLGATPWRWGEQSDARVIVTQTADSRWAALEPAWFPNLRLVYDGRNSLAGVALPDGVAYLGVGLPATARTAGARALDPA